MKKIILGVAAAAMTFASGAAMAQPYGYYDRGAAYRDSDGDGRSDRREWNRDRDRDGRPDQYDRRDNRRGDNYRGNGHAYGRDGYRGHNRWRQGQVYPYWRDRGYYVSDYRRYNLPPPRPGYRYYRSDNGDVVMAAIASGLIGAIIGGALADNDNDHRYYGR
ncbi:RcnB family protein [uncultured Phenylobacterium sp.]|uniref:RcnB family protein n=1 Tax=uncultured Phenylobacterium sp. TaxID=349273 RepID=UPI0025D02D9D|nr:RcnB family protein [uncultured Phenylobacterium sp.]